MQLRAETLAPPTPMTSEQLLALAKKLTADANLAADRIRALRLAISGDQEKPLNRNAKNLTGICLGCKEWTTVHEACCGRAVVVDGSLFDPDEFCADCGYEECQCKPEIEACLDCGADLTPRGVCQHCRLAAEEPFFTEADEHAVDVQRGK